MNKTCFVMQRFDGGAYDRRYNETFAPAIQEGGAQPIRADEVLGTVPVIEKIESGLIKASIAFSDVSEDNPNVFLELGYALCLNKPTVIVCDSSKRQKLPFDISHRPIIFYRTDSQSGFVKLSDDIKKNVRAALSEIQAKPVLNSDILTEDLENLDELKRVCLLELLDQDMRSSDGSSLWDIQRAITGSDYSERMVALAITSLVSDGLVEVSEKTDYNGNDYKSLGLSETGRKTILREYANLMKSESNRMAAAGKNNVDKSALDSDLDDEVPF